MGSKEISQKTEVSIFAAGCFWGVEKAFNQINGVIETEVGYTGGFLKNPSYEQVCSGRTGHAESIRIISDPNLVSYEELVDAFWKCHDPSSLNRQGNDIGSQYRSGIFYITEQQQQIANLSKDKLNGKFKKQGKQIQTEITKAGPFYRAEEYHQKYWKKKEGLKH